MLLIQDMRNISKVILINSEKELPVLRSSPLMGIIAPHAGYSYSGETASYAYNEIKKEKHSIR